MYNTSFIKKTLLALTVILLYSCDKDFNAIGDDLIGDNNFVLADTTYSVTAYNLKVTPVASNNLPINALGIYDNPVFGLTTANFNTQVALDSYAPTLGVEVVIDSVTLNIPYFSTAKSIDAKGVTTYELDSIYGPESGKLKLSVYESGIFLNNYNANNYDISKYYNTNRNNDFETQATTNPNVFGARLNNSTNPAENNGFFFNSKEIKETTPAVGTTPESTNRIKPEMRLHLDKNFFKTKIFDAPASKLAAEDVFRNYFKGLYFKVEKSTESTTTRMAMMNFKDGKINIFYKSKATTEATTIDSKKLVINLTGSSINPVNTVSLLEESNSTTGYTAATANDQDEDEKLYLKGGQGSMAIIELSDFESQLTDIRNNVTKNNWLVNEANLVFYVDETEMSKTDVVAPQRVYLYDATNNTPLLDYITDASTVNSTPKKNKYIFDGILQKTTGNKSIYKIRITDYIRNILKDNTAANVKLGLVVTENIGFSTSNKLDPTLINSNSIKEIPTASVMSPIGTVLFGGTSASADKKVKLQVYYTKPKPN